MKKVAKRKPRASKTIKMFVWHDLSWLRDYGNGVLCVAAHDVEDAIQLTTKDPDRSNEMRVAAWSDPACDRFEIVKRGAVSQMGSA